jgi:hypothetical protein
MLNNYVFLGYELLIILQNNLLIIKYGICCSLLLMPLFEINFIHHDRWSSIIVSILLISIDMLTNTAFAIDQVHPPVTTGMTVNTTYLQSIRGRLVSS